MDHSCFGISEELFQEIYKSGDYDDPHEELAKRLNVSRQKAKEIAFVKLYRNDGKTIFGSPNPQQVPKDTPFRTVWKKD